MELLEQIRKVREREGASIHELAPVPDSPPDGAGGAARRLGAAPALLALLILQRRMRQQWRTKRCPTPVDA